MPAPTPRGGCLPSFALSCPLTTVLTLCPGQVGPAKAAKGPQPRAQDTVGWAVTGGLD